MASLGAARFLPLGESLCLRKLSRFSRVATFHRSVRFLSRADRENGPLTLASVGFKSELQATDKDERNKLEPLVSTVEVAKPKMKAVRNNAVKAVRGKETLEAEFAPFSAKSFSELGLPLWLIERLDGEGFTVPTDVQSSLLESRGDHFAFFWRIVSGYIVTRLGYDEL
ncbi:unnamed protein product [Ilex paraguariensis]|uniref:DEAD-box RNA helicase Q domain-containing protein n=1 Tax=Ilex paraguariensis TaxID=185542 RepID=A0ABC8TVC3_9AQUA